MKLSRMTKWTIGKTRATWCCTMTMPFSRSSSAQNITYLCDNDGNLTSKTGGATTETFTHNEDSRLMQHANGSKG